MKANSEIFLTLASSYPVVEGSREASHMYSTPITLVACIASCTLTAVAGQVCIWRGFSPHFTLRYACADVPKSPHAEGPKL